MTASPHRDTVSKGDGNMETEYIPIFLEKKNGTVNGAWMHTDARINARILPLAYTSDIGILRLMVSNLDKAAAVLKKKRLIVRQTADAVEVVPDGSCGLLDILKTLAEHGIDTELTGIIPGIYQG
jgi:hypothetical protein